MEKKGPFFNHKASSPIIFYNDLVYIGDAETFLDWALSEFRYVDSTKDMIYKKRASDAMRALIDNNPNRNYVYMDIQIVTGDVQRVIIELFTQYAPKTCANFLQICAGSASNPSGEKLSYVGTEFSRVVKGMYVQGGDIAKGHSISKLHQISTL